MIKMTETNRIEYKQILADELEKEVVAFLNYHLGGFIYIGIDKNGKTIGIDNSDETQLKIKDRLKNNISPSCMGLFDVIEEERDGKKIIKIIVASGPEKPYYITKRGMSPKGCFIRVGSASEPMPVRMIEDFFAKRTRNSIGKIISPRQDLTFTQLKIYYEGKNLTLNDNFAKNLELLTEKGQYNYVAYLMADVNGVSIKLAKYSSLDRTDLIENNEYGYCSLIKSTNAVLDKLEIENSTSATITSRERIESRLWDAIAIREAVINAIVHNDYTREIPPKFEIFPDRLEITSYGGLFEGMSKEDFFSGLSLPKNKELMRIFKDLDMVEQLGSGIPRILRVYSKDCFVFGDSYTRMVFPLKTTLKTTVEETTVKILNLITDNPNISDRELLDAAGSKVGSKVGGKVGSKVGGNQLKILLLMHENPYITKEQLSKVLKISTTAVDNNIVKLKNIGKLKRVGPDKGGYWQVIE
jgi:ATP-dependent DNA helicase RecG